jgi:hypothetical protein
MSAAPNDPAEDLQKLLDERVAQKLNGLPLDTQKQQEKTREAIREFAAEAKGRSGKVRLKP